MLVKEVMSKEVDYISFNKSVQEAAIRMANGNYGVLPIEKNDKMIGMITDRDIALRVVALKKDPEKTTVEECMSTGVNYCLEDEDVMSLAQKMENTRHRRIPVINKEKRLVGIVSLGDLATKGKNKDLTQSVLEHIYG